MRTKLLQFYYDLQASYWFLPAVMVVCAIGLSFATIYIDQNIDVKWLRNVPWLYINQPDGARSVLSTIAGSMITVAGVTFSMTIVSVSFASSQFGPRLIGNFMRDKGNQLTLGTFIATFVYCLMILRSVRTGDNATAEAQDALEAFIPHISVLCGLTLALASVIVLIYYIHHIPESINISNITAQIGNKLRRDIRRVFPETLGKGVGEVDKEKPLQKTSQVIREHTGKVLAEHHGFIEAIDEKRLVRIATEHDITVLLQYRPGDFTTEGESIMLVTSDEEIDEELTKDLRSCMAWGRERTSTQNILFLADQLLEMIARALSPGVNDPYTAINCMNWLKCALSELAGRQTPEHRRYDEEGNLRVIAHPITFERFASAIFDDSLPYVSADRNAALHSMKVIGDVGSNLSGPQKKILLQHATKLNEACQERLPYGEARNEVDRRYQQLKLAFESPSIREMMLSDQGWLGGRA